MSYDQKLASRIRASVAGNAAVTEKQMFGGVAFLRHALMFVGVVGDSSVLGPGARRESRTPVRTGKRVRRSG